MLLRFELIYSDKYWCLKKLTNRLKKLVKLKSRIIFEDVEVFKYSNEQHLWTRIRHLNV